MKFRFLLRQGGCAWLWLTLLTPTITAKAQNTYTNTDGIWDYSSNGEVVTIYNYTGTKTELSIPDMIDGLPVTYLEAVFFDSGSNPTSVTIPDTVSIVGNLTFCRCGNLVNVTMGKGVTFIGDNAFNGCTNLTSLTLPESLTGIGNYAFYNCASLTNLSLPRNFNDLSPVAFGYCTNLTAINVDPMNSFYSSADGVVFDKSETTLVRCPEGKTGGYTVPNSVTNIGVNAFQSCMHLSQVIVPDSVNNLELNAFDQCTNLTNVSIGSGITSIGQAFTFCLSLPSFTISRSVTNISPGAFSFCTSLKTFTVDPLKPVYTSVDGIIFDKSQKTIILCPEAKTGSYAVPNNVSIIGEGAFAGCTGLSQVTIPNSITIIGIGAFGGCTGLNQVTIPNSVYSIGIYAFNNCTNLESVIIGSGVTNIGGLAFSHCFSLTNVIIGNGVTVIGLAAFAYCSGLANLSIGNSVKIINGWAFQACSSLTSVAIGDGVTNIDYGAFSECVSLTNVAVGSSVATIGYYGFERCGNLRGIHFKGNAPSLPSGTNAFQGDDLTFFYLPGTAGWGPTFAGFPAEPWVLPYPLILTSSPAFGVQSNQFGFTVSWATNISVAVEACTSLSNPVWQPVQTNALVNGSFYFSDPRRMDSPNQFYRVRWP